MYGKRGDRRIRSHGRSHGGKIGLQPYSPGSFNSVKTGQERYTNWWIIIWFASVCYAVVHRGPWPNKFENKYRSLTWNPYGMLNDGQELIELQILTSETI